MLVQTEQGIGGVDEAGRGPLAGPVVAAAVILPVGPHFPGLDDSKKLNHAQRSSLDELIRSQAISWSIAMATVEEIDSLNIHHATLLAMRRAVLSLSHQPNSVYVDGKFLPRLSMRAQAEIGGDARIAVIAAASILAKQARDRVMTHLHEQFPQYGFDGHKGYPTARHREALIRYGACPHHRRSYAPVRACLDNQARSNP